MTKPIQSAELKRKSENPLGLDFDKLEEIVLKLAEENPDLADFLENMTKEDELKFAQTMAKAVTAAINYQVEKRLKAESEEENKSNTHTKN